MSEIAIRVQNITKAYQIYDKPQDRLKQSLWRGRKQFFRKFKALDDVSFEVKKGETVGIIGRNGSGKSTLLQIICGTLAPTSGTVEVNGRVAALLELGAGFNPEFTGKENVYMNATILGLSKEEIDAKYDEIVSFADIGDFVNQPVKTYSSGMLVRLAFAVAINVDPQILIVDEALSVGDELFQRKCFAMIDTIKKKGATILFVSHAGGTIVELCEHAILMDAGEKLAMGTPKSIVANYHKLLYAPVEKQMEIRHFFKTSLLSEPTQESVTEPVVIGSQLLSNESEQNDDHAQLFNPHLKSTTSLFYESNGASINLPKIETVTGEEVNHLKSGVAYQYVYRVVFDKDAFDVRFGMMVKSVNGTEIGGIGSAVLGNGIQEVQAGAVMDVRFTFQCNLLPGLYFINAGCSAKIDGQDCFLHRIIDAVTFRVLPMDSIVARGGYVNIATKDYILIEQKIVPDLLNTASV